MAYTLEGRLLEVCTCKAVCPCWVGEDPDGGTCDGALAWRFDKGTIDGVDVSGLVFGMLAKIPGNVLKGNWRAQAFIDERATPEQQDAIVGVFTGQKGGPVADLAGLVGEVVGLARVPITFDVEQGRGHLRLGSDVVADLEPFTSGAGHPTTMADAVFSTIPGAPAFLGRAPKYQARSDTLGISVDLSGHNAVQGVFRFVG